MPPLPLGTIAGDDVHERGTSFAMRVARRMLFFNSSYVVFEHPPPMNHFPLLCAALCKAVLIVAALAPTGLQSHAQTNPAQNSSGPATPAGKRFRLVRAVSGTKGMERNGRFIVEDPRTIFHNGEDHKVIVECEWEGPVGSHTFEGLWKDPSGKVALVSDFQFAALKAEFAGYWSMLLDESAPTGIWTLETRIDGETAGSFSFEIVEGVGTTPPPAAPIPPTPAEIYKEATAATVLLEKLDSAGRQIDRSSAFFICPGQLLTTFGGIDGAGGVRVLFVDGRAVDTSRLMSWNRLQDWAVLRIDATAAHCLKLAASKSWDVGENAYAIDLSSTGGRLIQPSTIIGYDSDPAIGERLNLSIPFDPNSVGGPVLNEFGEVIGMLGPSGLISWRGEAKPPMAGSTVLAPMASVVPIDLVKLPAADAVPTTLAELMARGEFIMPLEGKEQVEFGVLALAIEHNKGGQLATGRPRSVFAKRFSDDRVHRMGPASENQRNRHSEILRRGK